MDLSVVHTADMHDCLDRPRAEALGLLRQQAGALLLDSGDAVGAGNVYVRLREPVLGRMNEAGYHAMAVGNREFFFRRSGMIRKTRGAQFPVLSANVRARRGDLGHIQRWITLPFEGQTVGVFGLTPTMIRPGSLWERFADVRHIHWRDAAREASVSLRAEVDWLVALSHRGLDDDLSLAELCPEIDLILGGHSHDRLTRAVGERPTLISHPGYDARSAVVVTAARDARGGNRFETRVVEMT